MKIVETNSGLGYGEVAYFIEYQGKFLCIYEDSKSQQFYKCYRVGELAELEDYEIEEVPEEKHQMIINESPIKYSFLFNFFIKQLD